MDVIDQPESGEEGGDNRINFALILSMIGPPVLWLIHFEIIYAWVSPACAAHSRFVLFLTSGICFLLVLVLGGIGWSARLAENQREEVARRVRFMAHVGVMISVLIALVIIAQTIATVVFNPCRV
jgi:hypothetical protein